MPLLNTDSPAIRERYSVFLLAQNRLLREALTVRCTPRVDRQLAALCAICGNYRGKTLVQEIDIYDLLLNGIHTEMARIESGDTILIPPVGPQMTVQGMVRRPAIYELGGETSLAEVLELAGSVVATGTLRHIDVERVVAIDKYMYLNVNAPILDDTIRVQYNQTERVRHVDEVQHTLAREALRYFHIDNGIEIVSVAGTGLGSSSCLLRWPAQCDAQPHSNPYQS